MKSASGDPRVTWRGSQCMSAITASRRKDLSDGFYLYKNIYLISLRSKAWDGAINETLQVNEKRQEVYFNLVKRRENCSLVLFSPYRLIWLFCWYGLKVFCKPLQHGYETLCEPVWCTSVTRSLTKYHLWLDDGYGWYVSTLLTLSLERVRIVQFPVGRIWHNKFIDTNIRLAFDQ